MRYFGGSFFYNDECSTVKNLVLTDVFSTESSNGLRVLEEVWKWLPNTRCGDAAVFRNNIVEGNQVSCCALELQGITFPRLT